MISKVCYTNKTSNFTLLIWIENSAVRHSIFMIGPHSPAVINIQGTASASINIKNLNMHSFNVPDYITANPESHTIPYTHSHTSTNHQVVGLIQNINKI